MAAGQAGQRLGDQPVGTRVAGGGGGVLGQVVDVASDQVVGQVDRGRAHPLLTGLVLEVEDPLFDHPVRQHHDEQNRAGTQADQLGRSDRRHFMGRGHHDGGVVGEA